MRALVVGKVDRWLSDPWALAFWPWHVELAVDFVGRFEEARAHPHRDTWQAVVWLPGNTSLSVKRALTQLPPGVRAFTAGIEVAGVTVLPTSPAALVAQLTAALGLTRSQVHDVPVVEHLGWHGRVCFERVRWPGAEAPLVRSTLARHGYPAEWLAAAARLGPLQGPGLATTLECFWDDPRPHVLQAVPPGVSLRRLAKEHPHLPFEVAVAIAAAVTVGLGTVHQAGAAWGQLPFEAVWLLESGEAQLVGSGLNQLPLEAPVHRGTVPPEELPVPGLPTPAGDAWRLAALLTQVLSFGAPPEPRPEPLIRALLTDRPTGPALQARLLAERTADGRARLTSLISQVQLLPPTPSFSLG